MAKLIYIMISSLDGYVEDAEGTIGWSAPEEEMNAYINELTSAVGTFLYGRRMYESMVYWEEAYVAHNHPEYLLEFAKHWQAAEKIVYSQTLAEPRSARTQLKREFEPEAIRRLKSAATKDITVSGAELAAQALRSGLVDELQLIVVPVILGGGKRYFPSGVRANLELIDQQSFRNGVVAMRYAVRG